MDQKQAVAASPARAANGKPQAVLDPLVGLRVKLFGDGADRNAMLDLYRNPLIQGFTTNPTLMRKAGVTDYRAFARDILDAIRDRPISLKSSPTILPRWNAR